MSPKLQVLRLQDYCVRYALSAIHDRLQTCKEDSKELHNCLIATLHSGIRQQLIDLAFIEYRRDANLMIEIVGLLLDSSIRSVEPKPETSYLNAGQCLRLFSIMDRVNATGLTELTIQVNPRISRATVERGGLAPLHRLLSRGLAQNLRTLVLRNACDNQMLGELGRAALCLKHLDISDNWLIDEVGIGQLLFKNPNSVCFPADLDSCEGLMLKDLSAIPDQNLTRCCFTLQEVRIQDTNTSAISVLMLLMFVKNLESLGGFLYYRNLGDCILSVKPYRSRLALTKLWDMHLPWDKMVLIADVTHRLHTLYTRVSQLALLNKQLPFTQLQDLTIDFDFIYEPRFVGFLASSGAPLTRLVLIDQVYSIDITVIANHCPLLVELAANVCLDSNFPKSELAYLKCARLKVNSAETFRWIMVNCPTIKRLEVQMDQEEEWELQGNFGMLNNKLIVELADLGLPSFDTIEHLSISFMNGAVERLDSNAIWTLVRACACLTRIEDVHTWQETVCGETGVADQAQQQYLNVAADLVEQNYDVDVRYRHISLTDFYRGRSVSSQHHTGILLAHAR